jgi:cytochrome c oxidase subunit 2
VIHSFKVIPMRINQDATPGMVVPLHFVPNRVGSYPINCAQLCGVGHSTMKGILHVMETNKFNEWLTSRRGAGAAADYE